MPFDAWCSLATGGTSLTAICSRLLEPSWLTATGSIKASVAHQLSSQLGVVGTLGSLNWFSEEYSGVKKLWVNVEGEKAWP
jgi:hypothetical protein